MSENIAKVDTSKDVNRVVIEFEDGTKKIVEKGAFMTTPEDLENGELNLEFIKMTGKEVQTFFKYMLYAAMEVLELKN